MLIKTKRRSDVNSSEITPESVYQGRRQFLKKSGQFAFAGLGLTLAGCSEESGAKQKKKVLATDYSKVPQLDAPEWLKEKVSSYKHNGYRTDEALTPYSNVSTYNNFYEFGTNKSDPAKYAKNFLITT